MQSKKLFIVIPTYNEKDNILNLIVDIALNVHDQNIDTHIVIVDDNSPDGTGGFVKQNISALENQYNFLKIILIEREGKLGLGSAYIRGFKEALLLGADYIMEMDADFSHQPTLIPIFISAAEDNDVIIGSRYIRGGKIENRHLIRKIISIGGNIYVRTILGMRIQDMTGGFNLYKSNVLKSIDLDTVKSNGYSFQIEMKYRSFKKKFKIKEIPIVFPERRTGKSKMGKKIFLEAIKIVWKLRFDRSIK